MKEGSRAISNARACACARARGAASRLTSRRSGMRLPCTREKKNPSGLRERARGVRCTSVPQSAGRFYDRDQKHEDVPGSYEITLRIATNNFEGIPFLFFFFSAPSARRAPEWSNGPNRVWRMHLNFSCGKRRCARARARRRILRQVQYIVI